MADQALDELERFAAGPPFADRVHSGSLGHSARVSEPLRTRSSRAVEKPVPH